MNVVHGGERTVKRTLVQGDVTFHNVPATTCACGQQELGYEGSVIGVAEQLAKRLRDMITPCAVTVDWDQLNPTLVEQLRQEYVEDWQRYLQQHPRRPNLSGLTGEEAEQRLLDRLFSQEPETVSCESLIAQEN